MNFSGSGSLHLSFTDAPDVEGMFAKSAIKCSSPMRNQFSFKYTQLAREMFSGPPRKHSPGTQGIVRLFFTRVGFRNVLPRIHANPPAAR